MHQILCSTGALTLKAININSEFAAILKEKLDCDGFEFMVDSSMYEDTEAKIKIAKAAGLNVPVIHGRKALGERLCGIRAELLDSGNIKVIYMTDEEDRECYEKGKAEFAKNLQVANALGAKKMVIHLWNGVPSDQNIQKNIERYGELSDMAKKAGVILMAENVICNKEDPILNLTRLKNAWNDASFVYDTKMAEFHNQTLNVFDDQNKWMFENRYIKHLHINDYDGGYKDWSNFNVLPIGKGHVDFESFFVNISKYGYDGDFTVEATAFKMDSGEIDYDMLNKCFSDLRKLIKKYM